MQKLRLLLVDPMYMVGGQERVVLTLAKHLRRDLFDVHVAVDPMSPMLPELRTIEGVRIHLVTMRGKWDVLGLVRLVRLGRLLRPDIVHSHGSIAGLFGRIAAWLTRCPINVWTMQLLPTDNQLSTRVPGFRRTLYIGAAGLLDRMSDQVLAVSDALKRERIAMGFAVPERMTVVPNLVDVDRYANCTVSREEARSRLGLADDERVLVFVGRLAPQKGLPFLLRALPAIRLRHPRLRLIVVGGGVEADDMRVLVKQLNLHDAVTFLGIRHDVETILPAADLAVLPSLYEGMPLAILEYMAAGKAVVATAVNGTPEIVEHGVTGLLVAPSDVGELEHAICNLLDQPELVSSMGARGAERVRSEFSRERFMERSEAVYLELAARKGLAQGERVAAPVASR